jgi:hypothetical protein
MSNRRGVGAGSMPQLVAGAPSYAEKNVCPVLYSWNVGEVGNSRKVISRIVHIGGPMGPETADIPGPAPNPKPYMSWWCIKMREGE